jgi:hypothetical protein
MKRLVRSRLDPLPRSISTKSLSLLVGMLLLGVGISVREYLESRRAPERTAPASTLEVLEGCTHSEPSLPSAAKPTVETGNAEAEGEAGARIPTVKARPGSTIRTAAPTEWIPETDASMGSGSSSGSRSSSVSEH